MSPLSYLGELATRSILLEVSAHPKPGLVTPYSCGCHNDMDFELFLKSSAVLSQGFCPLPTFGYSFPGTPQELFVQARALGVPVERRMFEVTGGINTQKGLVFLFHILLSGAGYLARTGAPGPQALAALVGDMCTGIVERELGPLKSDGRPERMTKGEQLYVDYGITGIRGEVEAGLPSVMGHGLPTFERTFKETGDLNQSLLQTLFSLMTVVEDTNIMSRKGLDMYETIVASASEVLDLGGVLTDEGQAAIKAFSYMATEAHISPGGSADLLSATLFMHFLGAEFMP
jgi:holo-ACP synthase/triphosphoribosyl-dephospho-CoA synthase